jgi:putative RecB family exonuclease
MRGQQRRTSAVWNAIERACVTEDFRPKVGPLCNFCHFKPSCPAFNAA